MAFGSFEADADGGPMAEINVTPMVDVMLVLLIIFMVSAPLLTVGVAVDLPQSKATSLAVVAPGIAEALFATAIGLIAAIPATIFYNKLTSEVNKQALRLEGFADEFAAILSRQIDERG